MRSLCARNGRQRRRGGGWGCSAALGVLYVRSADGGVLVAVAVAVAFVGVIVVVVVIVIIIIIVVVVL